MPAERRSPPRCVQCEKICACVVQFEQGGPYCARCGEQVAAENGWAPIEDRRETVPARPR